MISIAQLIAAGIGPTQAKQFADPLDWACTMQGIKTPVQIAMFIAQCAHESGGFVHLEEDLYYSQAEHILDTFPREIASVADAASFVAQPQKLANRVYAGKLGNGDEASGDGWTFRGRGLIQLTGRKNYHDASVALGQPYESMPNMVSTPGHAAMTAARFFVANGCLPYADASNVQAVTRVIAGPSLIGLDDRAARFEQAMNAFAGALA